MQTMRSLFLPVGYPDSVTADYLTFQLYDTIQAASSYFRGQLCTAALLTGMGVGSATASAASAAYHSTLRSAAGMIGAVLFAWRYSGAMGGFIKEFRLAADILNDVGLTLDLISPFFPSAFLAIALAGAMCHALCGVCAGATRAALMQHFAKDNNAADLSAKEGIQETALTLFGLIVGSVSTAWMEGSVGATWTVFIALTALHIWANWCAVTALHLSTLNHQRTAIVVRAMLADKNKPILTPRHVAKTERLFFIDRSRPQIRLGASISDAIPTINNGDSADRIVPPSPFTLDKEFSAAHIIRVSASAVSVSLRRGCSKVDELRAYFHAIIIQERIREMSRTTSVLDPEEVLRDSWSDLDELWYVWWDGLPAAGWKRENIELESLPFRYEQNKDE